MTHLMAEDSLYTVVYFCLAAMRFNRYYWVFLTLRVLPHQFFDRFLLNCSRDCGLGLVCSAYGVRGGVQSVL